MRAQRSSNPTRPAQLAALVGVSTDTLRHYERKGLLLSSRSANGYRAYPPDAVDRVRLVQRALTVGFTLDELASVVRVRDRGGAPCRRVRALAAAKLASMETRLRDLRALRDELRELLEQWDQRLANTPPGRRARLLQSWLATAPGPVPRPDVPARRLRHPPSGRKAERRREEST
jgi:DNA-binding transcriptional MerR regulator